MPQGEKFKSTFFMMVAERGINALVALMFITVSSQSCNMAATLASQWSDIRNPLHQIFGGSGLKIPIKEIFISGTTQMLAMAASNEALRYVSYPTQVRRRWLAFRRKGVATHFVILREQGCSSLTFQWSGRAWGAILRGFSVSLAAWRKPLVLYACSRCCAPCSKEGD